MAMNMHMEARRRQMFMERVCEARRRMALAQQQDNQGGTSSSFSSQSDPMVCQEQRMSNQTRACMTSRSVHVWLPQERMRRDYDHSREGPIHGQSWRKLEQELRFRENCLSSSAYPCPVFDL